MIPISILQNLSCVVGDACLNELEYRIQSEEIFKTYKYQDLKIKMKSRIDWKVCQFHHHQLERFTIFEERCGLNRKLAKRLQVWIHQPSLFFSRFVSRGAWQAQVVVSTLHLRLFVGLFSLGICKRLNIFIFLLHESYLSNYWWDH